MRFSRLVPALVFALAAVSLAQTDPAPTPVPPPVIEPPSPPSVPAPEPLPEPIPNPEPSPEPALPPAPPAPIPAPEPIPKPAPKPAPKAAPKPLELRADVQETFIRAGQMQTKTFTRVYRLPQAGVTASRTFKKVSTTLEPELRRVAASLAQTPENALWSFENGGWVARQRTGRALDETATRNAILEAVKSNRSLATVSIKYAQPARNLQSWWDMGIRSYFGGGTSTFYGSAPFRVENIIVGARRLNLTYIQPDEVFDFNRRVGNITAANGFVDGYIIKNGLLEKDVGGGICQVSTTIFRAAYESGLPITQRNFHSYRVHYYDPVGYEATVFAPYKNLKFKNDTGSALFIQASWDVRRSRLSFFLFGTAPDRKVSVSSPVVFGVRAAPPARWVADPAIRFGRVRVLSGPERGMNVRIDRVVTMNSGEVRRDSTLSYYVPWGAIYAVHPNDARVTVRPGYSVTGGSAQRTSARR